MAALSYELNNLGYPSKIVYEMEKLDVPNKQNHTLILFGYQRICNSQLMINVIKNFNLIIFNSEQLHTDKYKHLINTFIEHQKSGIINSVWDYSKKNATIMKNSGIKNIYLLPLGYSKAFEVDGFDIDKQRDDTHFIFIGAMNQRRIHLIDQLKKMGIPVKHIKNAWSDRYTNIINQNSLYLNIHYYKGGILELFRIVPILCNGGAVLSQSSDDPYLDKLYEPYVQFFYDTIKSNIQGEVIKKRLERYQKFKDNMKFYDLIKHSGVLISL